MNNNTLLTLCLVLITMLSVKLHCTNEQLNKELAIVNALENENATIAADRMLVLDSVDVLQDKLKESEKAKAKSLLAYNKKSRLAKTESIKKFGTITIVDDAPCLDSVAVDSINKLAIHYSFCIEDSKTKDTIIAHLTNANLKADTLLANKDTIIKAQTKVAKKANNLVKVWQGVSYGLAALTLIVYITAK
jgi:hypothetical protein